MKRILLAIFVSFMALSMGLGEASAKRLGGGKSVGVQRQAVTPRPTTPAATPAAAPMTPAGMAPAAPKRNWLGPIAGLAAGIGLAALFSHLGMGEGMANFAMIALLAMAAFFVIRLLLRRKATDQAPGMQYAGAGAGAGGYAQPPMQREAFGGSAGTAAPAAAAVAANVPADFDSEGFLRVAKLNFVRLQAANDAKNLDDMREFTSPELFAEIKLQMDERGNAPQQTDVVMLNAELLEVVTESNRHIASVRFYGSIREEANAAPAQFEEVWNLTKPVSGDKGWTVSGIQQVS